MLEHRLAVGLAVAALALPSYGLELPEDISVAVDEYVTKEIAAKRIPGVSVAILRDGNVVKVAGHGMANVELAVPVTPRTVFQIQSITKTFTSAAILMLLEDGALALEDPIGKHLEGVPETWNGITLRHLLEHTSGIKDFINEPTASLRLDVTEQEVLEATAVRPLEFPPGARWAYSNTNYHLLAMVIRKLSGKGYGEFLEERIFKPLGMSDTRIVSHADIIPNRASGYLVRPTGIANGEFIAESILGYGGGGIVSTAPDMIRWAAALQSGKILERSTIARAWTPARLTDGTDAGYGLGWAVESIEGHRAVSHGGGHVTGFTSSLCIYPDDGLAVAVLTNSGGAAPGRMARHIAGLCIPEVAPRPARPIEDKEPDVTASLRDCLVAVPEWKLDAGKFTPDFWKLMLERKAFAQAIVVSLGQVKAIDLMSRNATADRRTYAYRVTFDNGILAISMSLTADGRIADLSAEPE